MGIVLTDSVVVKELSDVPKLSSRVVTPADKPSLHKGLEESLAKVTHAGIILWWMEIHR